jgi:putative hydroxymethylpyrimidine transporter CytX
METKNISLLNNSLLWFGAAVSIAEIFTGTLFAPLGFANALLAILIGHVIGCTLLYLAGLIGAKRSLSAMETVRISFGSKGSYLFSIFNILQLLGWTAVMIISGARAIGVIADPINPGSNILLWCALIGVLIMFWIAVGIKKLGVVNIFAVGGLFVLTVILSTIVFGGAGVPASEGSMSFGAAVELSAAMPLSWLPLISDYTRHAKRPVAATLLSTLAYFVGSCWMYIIGVGAAIFAGVSDIARIMTAGLGLAGVLIVLLSTVTTTFLDAYSAGVSSVNIYGRVNEKWAAAAVCALGTLIAMFTPIEQYEDFLYLIGSVFAPMIAILITDFFILKKDHMNKPVSVTNLTVWAAGFAVYRLFMSVDTIVGTTLPVMALTAILCVLVEGVKRLCLKKC